MFSYSACQGLLQKSFNFLSKYFQPLEIQGLPCCVLRKSSPNSQKTNFLQMFFGVLYPLLGSNCVWLFESPPVSSRFSGSGFGGYNPFIAFCILCFNSLETGTKGRRTWLSHTPRISSAHFTPAGFPSAKSISVISLSW